MKRVDNIRKEHKKWNQFLSEKIEFWMKTSEKHTKEHCSRVLLYALFIASQMDLSDDETEVLCMASVFHDSRRQDDWYDVGHGQRAAEYYREYCRQSEIREIRYDPRCYDIMYYHDRDDEIGIAAMETQGSLENEVLLYWIFKDSDALDRFRLGPNGLDVAFLRTEAAKSLYPYAKHLWDNFFSELGEEKNKGDLWDRIYQEIEIWAL